MKKVLLIGELNQTLSTINKYLQTKFQTQICVDTLELVEGMTKVYEPDMAVICLAGVGGLDSKILEYFKTRRSSVPVLLVGTPEECNFFQEYFEGEQFDCLASPMTSTEFMEKCSLILQTQGEVKLFVEEKQVVGSKKLILVVDDSGILLRSVKSMLVDQYQVAVATDGKKGIERAKERKPDLILLDYEMPVMDGKETLEELRKDEDLKDIPVVFLTSVASREIITSLLRLKPEGYLLKPIDQKRMIETIESILETK